MYEYVYDFEKQVLYQTKDAKIVNSMMIPLTDLSKLYFTIWATLSEITEDHKMRS